MSKRILDLDKMIENMKVINAGYQQVTFKEKDYSITIIIDEVEK